MLRGMNATHTNKGSKTMTKINIKIESSIQIIRHGSEIGSGSTIKSAWMDAISNCPKSWTIKEVEDFLAPAYEALTQFPVSALIEDCRA
jgi:hypothetical protein